MRKFEVGVVVTVVLAMISGALWVGNLGGRLSAVERTQDEPLKKVAAARDEALAQLESKSKTLTGVDMSTFSQLPVGSILPYAGAFDSLATMPEWKLCDGSILLGPRYKNSPFYNRALPRLEGVFLRATLNAKEVLTPGGADTALHSHSQSHIHPIPHNHSGRTETEDKQNGPPTDYHDHGGQHTHRFTTGQPDAPNSGQPDAPRSGEESINVVSRFVAVYYIIKVV